MTWLSFPLYSREPPGNSWEATTTTEGGSIWTTTTMSAGTQFPLTQWIFCSATAASRPATLIRPPRTPAASNGHRGFVVGAGVSRGDAAARVQRFSPGAVASGTSSSHGPVLQRVPASSGPGRSAAPRSTARARAGCIRASSGPGRTPHTRATAGSARVPGTGPGRTSGPRRQPGPNDASSVPARAQRRIASAARAESDSGPGPMRSTREHMRSAREHRRAPSLSWRACQ